MPSPVLGVLHSSLGQISPGRRAYDLTGPSFWSVTVDCDVYGSRLRHQRSPSLSPSPCRWAWSQSPSFCPCGFTSICPSSIHVADVGRVVLQSTLNEACISAAQTCTSACRRCWSQSSMALTGRPTSIPASRSSRHPSPLPVSSLSASVFCGPPFPCTMLVLTLPGNFGALPFGSV